MPPEDASDGVCPYRVERELERRHEFPLEELRALRNAVSGALDAGDISDDLFVEFLARMDLGLEYQSYWAEDWEVFERNDHDWANS